MIYLYFIAILTGIISATLLYVSKQLLLTYSTSTWYAASRGSFAWRKFSRGACRRCCHGWHGAALEEPERELGEPRADRTVPKAGAAAGAAPAT